MTTFLLILINLFIAVIVADFSIFVFEYRKYRIGENITVGYYNPNTLFSHDLVYINGEELPLFSFKSFLNFYSLNPKGWAFYDKEDQISPCPARVEVTERRITNNYNDFRINYKPIFFSTLNDYRKYKKWAKKEYRAIKATANSKRRYEKTEEFIKLIQKDIDNKKEEAKQDLDKTKELMEGCVNNDK